MHIALIFRLNCILVYHSGFVPSGFGVQNEENTVVIHFKAVLFKPAWTWDEKTSKVFIRFLHEELGNMKYDYGSGCFKEHLSTRYSACMHGIYHYFLANMY